MLLRHGASHWDALHTAQQPQAGTNSSYRGVVTTLPSPTFLVLTNSTKVRQAREHKQTASAYLDWMTYHDFTALGCNTSHLGHYSHEFHYFQGTPHEELKLKDAFGSLPSSCWNAQHSGKSIHSLEHPQPDFTGNHSRQRACAAL